MRLNQYCRPRRRVAQAGVILWGREGRIGSLEVYDGDPEPSRKQHTRAELSLSVAMEIPYGAGSSDSVKSRRKVEQ